ncbi:G patch domain and ankyrin repeat-containing protein 1 homolog isoform X2 [Oratosquilla oratoria]
MASEGDLHPNSKVLTTGLIKWKKFVKEKPESPLRQEPPKAKVLPEIRGEEAKGFYEHLIKDKDKESVPNSLMCKVEKHIYVENLDDDDEDDDDSFSKESQTCINKRIIYKAMQCAQSNDVNGLKKCLDEGVPVNSKDDYGWSLLMIAACAGARQVIQELLLRGAKISTSDKKGNTAMYLAAKMNHPDIVDTIIKSRKKKESEDQKELPVESDKRKKVESFYCNTCKAEIKESTRLQHETSIAHQFSMGPGSSVSSFGIPASNKGYQLLVNSGWDAESGLGPSGTGTKFPVKTVLKRDRKGLGKDEEKPIARVTHFGPGDKAAVKRAADDSVLRTERLGTLNRKKKQMERRKEKILEINLRRQLNEPEF